MQRHLVLRLVCCCGLVMVVGCASSKPAIVSAEPAAVPESIEPAGPGLLPPATEARTDGAELGLAPSTELDAMAGAEAQPSAAARPSAAIQTAQAESSAAPSEALAQVLAWHPDLSTWKPSSDKAFLSEGHELAQARGYLNDLASKRTGTAAFAPGAALALVEELPTGGLGRSFFMVKMEAGFDAAGSDWFYAELDASGQALFSGSSAEQMIDRRCASCHRLGAKGSDLVYGPPAAQ